MDDRLTASLEAAALADGPPGAVVAGSSVSPDGTLGATLTLLPGASYLMDDVFERTGDSWTNWSGGSGGGTNWTTLPDPHVGVLRFGGEAPPDVSLARVRYEGEEYGVSVRHGHFLLVVWGTEFREDPHLVGFV